MNFARLILLVLILAASVASRPSVYGQVFEVLAVYNSGINNSEGLVEGNDGNFYGTGTDSRGIGQGAVFKVTPDGQFTTLAAFNSSSGHTPYTTLVEGSSGDFYGTTYGGGASGYGTVFKVTSAGVLTPLISFDGSNGRSPRAGLIKGSDGNFYGTTVAGGASSAGTIFKITPEGVLTPLAEFNGTNGRYPSSKLLKGSDGCFYGATEAGGTSNFGAIFKLAPDGILTALVSFDRTNGSYPFAEVVEGSDGCFYGTTLSGGADDKGTVFKVTPDGSLTTLVSFNGTNGSSPLAGMLAHSNGALYGVTRFGGASGHGTVFKMTPAGELTTLHSFDGLLSARPNGTPIFGSDGKLYGAAGQLAIWRLSIPLPPSITADSVEAVTATAATLRGAVNANLANTTVTFEYGPTPEYGTTVAATPGTITGTSATPVSVTLAGLLPHTTYYYRFTATNSEGVTSTETSSFTTANTLPVAAADRYSPNPTSFGAFSIDVLENDSDADGDPLTITAVTQGAFGAVTTNGTNLTYTPGPGFIGRDTFSYTVSDGFDTATAQVELRAVALYPRILFAQGLAVPGAGQEGSEIAAGSLFASFGIPALNSAGNMAFMASYAAQGSTGELSLLVLDPQAQGSKLIARRGQPAPGTEGALFASFKAPLLNDAGDVVFLGTLSSGDATKKNKQGIWINAASAENSAGTQLLARTGAQAAGAPAGAKWKSFTSVAFSSGAEAESNWTLSFTGFMAPGVGGVKANSDMGLWLASPGRTVLALREGQKLEIDGVEKKIRTFAALKSMPGAPDQGGGVTTEGGVAAQVFFTDGSQAMLRVSDDATAENIAIEVLALPGDAVADMSETAVKFGIPAQSGSGTAAAWIGALSGKGKPAAIFERNLNNSELLHLLAHKGGTAAGIEGATFNAFTNVAVNDSGSALFLGKVRGSGVGKRNDVGLWWRRTGDDPASFQLLAREGDQPPGFDEGMMWHSFSSVALPEGSYGPLFTARLKSDAYGSMGYGLWAVNSSGVLQRVVSAGGKNTPSFLGDESAAIQSFTVLSAALGSPTQRRSYNDAGRILLHVVFHNPPKTEGIIAVQLP